jgi:hypothetical protein
VEGGARRGIALSRVEGQSISSSDLSHSGEEGFVLLLAGLTPEDNRSWDELEIGSLGR